MRVIGKVLDHVGTPDLNAEMSSDRHLDPLYLLACYFEWRSKRDSEAYDELVAVLHDSEGDARSVAEALLMGSSLAAVSAKGVVNSGGV